MTEPEAEREFVFATPAERAAADRLLEQAGGDANDALSMAQEIEAEAVETDGYWFARAVRLLCHHRANAAYEGFALFECIEPEGQT